jgi:putative colanic acid biosynthesis UDP-glucose lipid carrier transferase
MNRTIGPAGWLTRLAPLFDGLAVLLAGYAAYYLRFSRLQLPSDYLLALLLGVLLALVLLPASRSYRGVRWHRPVRGVLSAAPGLVAVFGALMLLATLTKTTAEFSRIWMVAWLSGTVVLMSAWRWLVRRQADRSVPRVLLIGTGALAIDAARRLQSVYGDRGLVGFVRLEERQAPDSLPAPVLGEIDELETIVQSDELAVSELWLATDTAPSEDDDHLLHQLRLSSLPVRYVPDLRVLRLLGHRASEVAGMTVIELNATPLDGPDALVKALMDRLIAGVLLVVLAPLLLLIVVAIKLDSRGPVLFGQPRHGGGGRVIRVLKFRSMRPGNPDDARQARRDDPRVTRVGRLLRQTSLDELPQLFNVLRGEMSLVGPRPHPLALNEAFSGRLAAYMQRHRVKPGITGLAQINGYRGETDTLEKMQKRLEYDLEYIENWSLGLDLRILARTALTGWVDRNAY